MKINFVFYVYLSGTVLAKNKWFRQQKKQLKKVLHHGNREIKTEMPNLFRRMFGEGTLTSAFLPIFSESSKIHSQEYAFSFLNQIGLTLI